MGSMSIYTATNMATIHIVFEIWGAIFCLIAVVCVYVMRHFDRIGARSLCALLGTDVVLNLNEALAYWYRGNETQAGFLIVRVSNFAVFFCNYLLLVFGTEYVFHIIEKRVREDGGNGSSRKWRTAVHVLCGIGILLLILSRIFGFYYAFDGHNRYYRLPESYWIMLALEEAVLVLLFLRTLLSLRCFRPLERIAFLNFELLPVAGVAAQAFFYGVSLTTLADTVAHLFLFVTYELEYAEYMVEQERKTMLEREKLLRENIEVEQEKVSLLKKQVEVEKERIHLYHSQIQPHFIYNSLTAIHSYRPPESKANEVLSHFTGFLRGSMELLTETECIRAEQEFVTVSHYLYMEKERFGEDIHVVLDLQDQDFFLPAFTVQTLVENAVRHGIRESEEGCGTVTVKSYHTDTGHIVEVQDDGMGFNVSLLLEENRTNGEYDRDDRSHIGIQNIRKRLEMMCGGTLEIVSAIGAGTLARVWIPLS